MSDPTIDANGANGRSSSTEASTLDPMQSNALRQSSNKQVIKTATTMLPTPAKTPRKKQVQSAAVNGAARVLFPVHPVEDAMPTPRKRRNKRTVGFSLYNDEDNEEEKSEERIQIYTDSKDKLPELDPSEDNPFYEKPKEQSPPSAPNKGRSSRKRKAAPSAEDRKEIKEAFNREEGMVYVLSVTSSKYTKENPLLTLVHSRGKKIFRKFPEDGGEPDDGEDSEVESTNVRPLTRSSIKPRLLFPTQKQTREREAANTEDEEATTDIEDHNDTPMSDPEEEQHVTTPRKQTVFSPATPPTTGHATRQATKRTPEELVKPIPYKGKKVSPFDGWARTKAGSANGTAGGGKGRKREAEAMEKADGARGNKKVRGAAAT